MLVHKIVNVIFVLQTAFIIIQSGPNLVCGWGCGRRAGLLGLCSQVEILYTVSSTRFYFILS